MRQGLEEGKRSSPESPSEADCTSHRAPGNLSLKGAFRIGSCGWLGPESAVTGRAVQSGEGPDQGPFVDKSDPALCLA